MRLGSLRLRLMLAAGAFVLVAMALFSLGLTYIFKSHVERWIEAELNADLDQLVAGIDATPDGTLAVTKPPNDPRFERPLSEIYWQAVVEPAGPVLRSRSLWDYQITLPPESVGSSTHQHLVTGPAGQALYLLQRRVKLPARLGGHTVRAAIGLNDAEVRAAVWRFAAALMPLLFVIGSLLTAAAWMQVGFGLRPLAAMRRKLADIGSGAESRLGTGFPEEVQPLAREIDALLDARDEQIEKARARAADLAHGLKTPLQALASETQRLRKKGDASLAAEIEDISLVMQRHVDRHLARTRMAAADPNAKANIVEVVTRVVRVMQHTPQGRDIGWQVDVPNELVARMDAQDLTEALGNLVENAVRYAQTRVRIFAARDGASAVLTVADDGAGIPADQRGDALRRGTRLDVSGSGEGLGLAIVNDIAHAWGADLSLDTRDGDFLASLRMRVL